MSILLSYILSASLAYANVISYLVALATGNPFTLEFVVCTLSLSLSLSHNLTGKLLTH